MARPRFAPVLAYYLATAGLSSLLVIWGMRLDLSDLREPLGYNGGDVMLILPMAQAVGEAGSQWSHPRLAAPGTQDLRDFPVVDYLHFAGIRLIELASGDLIVAFNVYFLLTYPLAALTTLYALRRLGLSWPAAVCGAILYAFTPYHQARNLGHYFLSAYYIVPLTLVIATEIAADPQAQRSRLWWVGATLIALLTAISGAYYAYFGCAALAFAGCYGALASRSWRPLARASGVTAMVVAGGIAGHLPSILYQAEAGRNPAPTFRLADEAEIFGLKLAQLVLPIKEHRVPSLAAIRTRYDSPHRPLQNENDTGTLGLIGATGLIGLLAALVLPASGRVRALAALVGFLVLFGTVGGIGALFNHLVSPQVRAYCRVSIFLAFFGLLAALAAIDYFVARPRWRWPLYLALGTLGVLDQTGTDWFTPTIAVGREKFAIAYRADREFYSQADDVENAMVFCLPYFAYPETTQVGELMGYDHARGVVHTKHARWSFGPMKGRAGDAWLAETSALPLPELLDRIAARGFTHLYINLKGYSRARGGLLLARIYTNLGMNAELTPHADGKRRLFDIRDYTRRRTAELGGLDALAETDRNRVRAEFLSGFVNFESPREEARLHLLRPNAELVLVNPIDAMRRLRITFLAKTLGGKTELSLDAGNIWADRFEITELSSDHSAVIELPPGRTLVRWSCPRPPGWLPGDGRKAVAQLQDFVLTEVE